MLILFKWLVVRPLKFFKTNKTLKKKFSSSRLGTCFTTTLPPPRPPSTKGTPNLQPILKLSVNMILQLKNTTFTFKGDLQLLIFHECVNGSVNCHGNQKCMS